MNTHRARVPIIDITALVSGLGDRSATAAQIGQACQECGFFYVVNHGVDEGLQIRLEQLSRQFFAQDLSAKLEIEMAKGGRAWRGYFPVGGELTSDQPDLKEGIYFGAELRDDHPLVRAGTPLHGANLFPAGLPPLRAAVLDYLDALTKLGHTLMAGLALSLGLPESYFADRFTADPLVLFRIFNYPASSSSTASTWGVGEHTDYGLLTILRQDDAGGLEVKTPAGWTAAPPISGSFICNIGDMLERITGGRYRSTPHRVRNRAARDRLSFAFFFDPNFAAEITPIDFGQSCGLPDNKNERWDQASVHDFQGTYGEYLLRKVARVFPELQREVLSEPYRPLH